MTVFLLKANKGFKSAYSLTTSTENPVLIESPVKQHLSCHKDSMSGMMCDFIKPNLAC